MTEHALVVRDGALRCECGSVFQHKNGSMDWSAAKRHLVPETALALLPGGLLAPNWVGEACDDHTEGTGGVANGGRIARALRPLVLTWARKKGIEEMDSWRAIRPYWRMWCQSDDAKFGPECFAANPRRVIKGQRPEELKGKRTRMAEAAAAQLARERS